MKLYIQAIEQAKKARRNLSDQKNNWRSKKGGKRSKDHPQAISLQ